MLYLKNILSQIEDLTGIEDIIGASEEIASMKMRGIRNKVLLSRDMNEELTEIYREVTLSYRHQIEQLLKEQKDKQIMMLKKGNGKTACVYLSANSGFFSKILEKTYAEFVAYLSTHDATPIIIGEFGKKLFTNQFPNRDFIFYTYSEKADNQDSLKEVTQSLLDYDEVRIFYARFESMASQTIAQLNVSGTDGTTAATGEITHYLFEPSLEKILAYFEGEIFAGIIQQTFTESELARYASRITTLDIARENINLKLKAMALEKRFASHRMMNKKQNELLGGISLWKLA